MFLMVICDLPIPGPFRLCPNMTKGWRASATNKGLSRMLGTRQIYRKLLKTWCFKVVSVYVS